MYVYLYIYIYIYIYLCVCVCVCVCVCDCVCVCVCVMGRGVHIVADDQELFRGIDNKFTSIYDRPTTAGPTFDYEPQDDGILAIFNVRPAFFSDRSLKIQIRCYCKRPSWIIVHMVFRIGIAKHNKIVYMSDMYQL